MVDDLVIARPEGLYCPPGDFYIDPWRPVDRAVITHGHSDHARSGHAHYLSHTLSAGTLRQRLGAGIALQTLDYAEPIEHHGVRLSLHPAGHVLGSAQVRLERGGRVWVASGDYKTEADGTCAPFEAVRCDTFITESTFGLPIYRWPSQATLFDEINTWWRRNASESRVSVLQCYAFGKAQRVLSRVDAHIGPIVVHAAVEPLNAVYRSAGAHLPETHRVTDGTLDKAALKRALVIAPPSAQGTPWMKRFGTDASDAFTSGWMQVRGRRRRRGVDRGFVMSDHADWPGLLSAIEGTGAQHIRVTHGSVPVLAAVREIGIDIERIYVTDAVKHFSYTMRGKRRMRKTPAQADVQRCAQWLQAELLTVGSSIIIALGRTALNAIGQLADFVPSQSPPDAIDLPPQSAQQALERGRWRGALVAAVAHPSALLRAGAFPGTERYQRWRDELRQLTRDFCGS